MMNESLREMIDEIEERYFAGMDLSDAISIVKNKHLRQLGGVVCNGDGLQ